jgi:hypothetical protein
MLSLGRFRIYRFRSEPYELLMKHVRTFTPDNPRFTEYSAMARVLASRVDHKNVARIHSLNICSRTPLLTQAPPSASSRPPSRAT